MRKSILAVLGNDQVGVIAAIARVLAENHCNIENVSQTILQSQFTGIFIIATPDDHVARKIQPLLEKTLRPMGLQIFIAPLAAPDNIPPLPVETEPFVITTKGPDRVGLVAGITAVLARHQANITYLKAFFKGGSDPFGNIMIYEIDLPRHIQRDNFFDDLKQSAQNLGLDVTMQHRKIFEAINRI